MVDGEMLASTENCVANLLHFPLIAHQFVHRHILQRHKASALLSGEKSVRYVSGPRGHRVAVGERESGVLGSDTHFISLSGWTGYSRSEHNARSFP